MPWKALSTDSRGVSDTPKGSPEVILLSATLRGEDSHGQGHYGASRGNGASRGSDTGRGSRVHRGIDYCAEPGQLVLSHLPWAIVSKIGYPYSDDLSYRYVELMYNGHYHRVFYITPAVEVGDEVVLGHPVGYAQDIESRYSPGMKNHVHYEVKDTKGNYIDPDKV